MSNPWNTTPADLALTPFHHLLHNFETSNNSPKASSSSSALSTNFPSSYDNSIVTRLRKADRIIQGKRESQFQEKAMEVRPEIKICLDLELELTTMFQQLFNQLEKIQQSPTQVTSAENTNPNDLLRQAYLRVFHSSQVVWDDISHENKAKLVHCIRSAIKAIFYQIQQRGKEEQSFATHQKIVSDLLERTTIFDEKKEFDDFYLEDLYDLLTECSNSLELIRRHQQPFKANKATPSKSTDSLRDLTALSPEKTNQSSATAELALPIAE